MDRRPATARGTPDASGRASLLLAAFALLALAVHAACGGRYGVFRDELYFLACGNYGEAAALDLYGPALGLPPAASGHNSYFLWGPPPGRGDPVIIVGDEREDCGRGTFRERIRAGATPVSPWVMPYESGRTIWICRGATRPVEAIWPSVRIFI